MRNKREWEDEKRNLNKLEACCARPSDVARRRSVELKTLFKTQKIKRINNFAKLLTKMSKGIIMSLLKGYDRKQVDLF